MMEMRSASDPTVTLFFVAWPPGLYFTYEPTQRRISERRTAVFSPALFPALFRSAFGRFRSKVPFSSASSQLHLRTTAIINCCLEFDAARSNWQTSRSWSPTQPSMSTPLLTLLLVLSISLNASCPRSLSSWSLGRMLSVLEEAEPLHHWRLPHADNLRSWLQW